MNIIERLKSPIVISDIVAAIAGILLNLGVIPATDGIISVANIVIALLIAVGVLNNPTDKEKF